MASVRTSAIIAGLFFSLFLCSQSFALEYYYGKSYTYFYVKCSAYNGDQVACQNSGCYWWDDSCHAWMQGQPTKWCIKLDPDITLCKTTTNDYYILTDIGESILWSK